jgi:hypothetical protein
MSSCHHHGRKDGDTISRGETLDKTHDNQSLNPNGIVATNYKGSRGMGTPLDAPLLGSDMIHGHLDRFWKLDFFVNSGRLRF